MIYSQKIILKRFSRYGWRGYSRIFLNCSWNAHILCKRYCNDSKNPCFSLKYDKQTSRTLQFHLKVSLVISILQQQQKIAQHFLSRFDILWNIIKTTLGNNCIIFMKRSLNRNETAFNFSEYKNCIVEKILGANALIWNKCVSQKSVL